MSVSLGANGSNYNYPETGELSWGANATNFASAVSGSISLPFRGAFHLSLTVLVHYRSL